MAIGQGLKQAFSLLKSRVSKLELFALLFKLKLKQIFQAEINALRSRTEVANYINKLRVAEEYNVVKECPICYETKLSLYVGECMHLVCQDCYLKVTKCPYCNVNIVSGV